MHTKRRKNCYFRIWMQHFPTFYTPIHPVNLSDIRNNQNSH